MNEGTLPEPIERLLAGNPEVGRLRIDASGVSLTATATEKKNASRQLCLVSPLMRKTSGTITMMKRIGDGFEARHQFIRLGVAARRDRERLRALTAKAQVLPPCSARITLPA